MIHVFHLLVSASRVSIRIAAMAAQESVAALAPVLLPSSSSRGHLLLPARYLHLFLFILYQLQHNLLINRKNVDNNGQCSYYEFENCHEGSSSSVLKNYCSCEASPKIFGSFLGTLARTFRSTTPQSSSLPSEPYSFTTASVSSALQTKYLFS